MRDTERQKTGEEIDRIYVEAGARILKCRTDKKLSRNSLAKAAGISSKFLYEIESGHTGFTVGVLERLANALRVDSDYILHGRLARQNCDEDLIKAISAFDEEKLQKLDLEPVIYDLLCVYIDCTDGLPPWLPDQPALCPAIPGRF